MVFTTEETNQIRRIIIKEIRAILNDFNTEIQAGDSPEIKELSYKILVLEVMPKLFARLEKI